jgi:hypothetical protein
MVWAAVAWSTTASSKFLVVVWRQRVGGFPNVVGHCRSRSVPAWVFGQRLPALAQLLFLDPALELVAAALE